MSKDKRRITPNTYVVVKNGFDGVLVYKNKRTGEVFIWNELGDELDIQVSDLKTAKSSSKKFFENNWFVFDDEDIIKYLGVERYYENALDIDDVEDFLNKPEEEVASRIKNMSNGQKKTLSYRVKAMVNEGRIDSVKTITMLEEQLGIRLLSDDMEIKI